MTSRITCLHTLYGKYNEILPEELVENLDDGNSIATELESYKTSLEEIIGEDLRFIENIARQCGLRSLIKELSQQERVVRWAFELDDEDIVKKQGELVKERLAQWLVCKDTLILLSQKILEELPLVTKTYVDYKKGSLISREKRMAFMDFTLHYQNFIGYSVNVRDIIDDYHDTFNLVCKQIDPNYEIKGITERSAVHSFELKEGIIGLLLRGGLGRYTPFPDLQLDIDCIEWALKKIEVNKLPMDRLEAVTRVMIKDLEKRKDKAMKRSDTDDLWTKIESLQWVLFVLFALRNGNMIVI